MAKGSGQAQTAISTGNAQESTLNGRAGSAFNAAMPSLMNNASGTQGMTQQQMAQANTAAQQSAGGSNAGITGQGDLAAGRTGNPGSMANAVGMAGRGVAKGLSNAALNVQEQNSQMAQQKQNAALDQLGKLYGTNVSGMNEMMGNVNKATSNLTTADQDTTGDIMKGAQMATSMVGM